MPHCWKSCVPAQLFSAGYPSPLWLICFVIFCSIKLGVIEDHSNRTRLAKLLKFFSSNSDTEQTTLAEYIERMKEKQEHIYFMAGTNRGEVFTLCIQMNFPIQINTIRMGLSIM